MGLTVFWSQPKSNPIERKNQSNLSTAQVSGPIIGLARPSLITMVGRVLQIQSPNSINNAKTINGALTLKFERLVTPKSLMIYQTFDIAINFPILSLQQKRTALVLNRKEAWHSFAPTFYFGLGPVWFYIIWFYAAWSLDWHTVASSPFLRTRVSTFNAINFLPFMSISV